MLGKNNNIKETVISGRYAEEMIDALKRVRSGNYNDQDLMTMERSKRILGEYKATWKE